MPTSKILTTPQILEIVGSSIRVGHPDISGYTSTSLAAQIAAAGTAMSVLDNNNFADNDWMLVGKPGVNQTETTDVNGAVTRGQSKTVTNSLSFAHEIDAPVTKIFERGIKIYGAATDGGSGTLIASIDALTASGRQLADAVMIQWDKPYTEYTLISTDTTYAYYYATFTDGTTDSSASDYVLAAGIIAGTVERFIDKALDITGQRIGERVTRPMMVRWANDCQDAITQFKYQDPRTGLYQQKDWSFEVTRDETSLAVASGENTHALSGLTTAFKYPNSDKSVINVQMGVERPLVKIDVDDYDRRMIGKPRTDLTVAASAGDTSITVTATADFADSGGLLLGGDNLTYTAKTATTFTGIPASGTGAITATGAVGASVWQNFTASKPERYVIFEGNLLLDKPVASTWNAQKLRIRYIKALTELTTESDVTQVTFTNVFPTYLVAMIYYRNGKDELGDKWMEKFEEQVLNNALSDFIPATEEYQYYNFGDEVYGPHITNEEGYYDYYEFL
jgi:hypothetical protein